jgi:hypothetical protein
MFTACSDRDDSVSTDIPELAGTWILIEQYSDLGDGSGEFVKVKSKKSLEFLENGRFKANGKLCTLDTSSGPTTYGKFVISDSLNQYSPENYLVPEGCEYENLKVYYHLDGPNLILSYPCIEGCAQKFAR